MYSYDDETPQRPRVLGRDGVTAKLPAFLAELGPLVAAVFSEVQQRSPVPVILRVTDLAPRTKIDDVVSIGGGSCIDSARGVAWYTPRRRRCRARCCRPRF